MIVCLCKGVCDKRVRACIAAGATSVEQVGESCGAGTGCGACCDTIAALIEADPKKSTLEIIHGEAA
jgi:bacterioferritin-associated ferredoxin